MKNNYSILARMLWQHLEISKEHKSEDKCVRKEMVAQFKKQIDNGTYKIDGDRIAGKMIVDSILNSTNLKDLKIKARNNFLIDKIQICIL